MSCIADRLFLRAEQTESISENSTSAMLQLHYITVSMQHRGEDNSMVCSNNATALGIIPGGVSE